MNGQLLAVAAFLFAASGYLYARPQQVRNFVSGAEWQRNPDAAAAKQKHRATVAALATGSMGVLFLLVALVG